jgi:hypothetical protein
MVSLKTKIINKYKENTTELIMNLMNNLSSGNWINSGINDASIILPIFSAEIRLQTEFFVGVLLVVISPDMSFKCKD